MDVSPNPPLLGPGAVGAAADGAAEAREAATRTDADFDSFLRLLTAQLRNQDPLQPLDSTEFVAQLASFSTVEQLIGTNDRLDRLAEQAEDTAAGEFATWIGREASLTDGSFVATGEERAFRYDRVPGADRALAVVKRPDGSAVATVPLDPSAGGEAVWDGRAADGALITGPHRIDIAQFSAGELLGESPASVYRRVTGIRGGDRSGDAPLLIEFADGGTARPGDIFALRAPPEPED